MQKQLLISVLLQQFLIFGFIKMTIHYTELIRLVAELCEDKDLKAAATESLKGGLITGVSAVVGGVLLGPIGLALGGLIGGVGAAVASNDFKPVAQILLELPPEKKMELARKLKNAFRHFGVDDIAYLLMFNKGVQDLAIREVTNYLGSMSLSVKSE